MEPGGAQRCPAVPRRESSGDIQAGRRWCGLTSLTCARPQQMALRLARVRSVRQPSRRVRYAGCSRARVTISKRREQTRLDQLLHLWPEVQAVYARLAGLSLDSA